MMNVNVVPFGSTIDRAEHARRGEHGAHRQVDAAVAITNVMPIASTPMTLDWVRMLRTLSQVGNVSGFRIAPATNSSDDDEPERVLLQPAGPGDLERRARRCHDQLVHATSSARSGVSVGATA